MAMVCVNFWQHVKDFIIIFLYLCSFLTDFCVHILLVVNQCEMIESLFTYTPIHIKQVSVYIILVVN